MKKTNRYLIASLLPILYFLPTSASWADTCTFSSQQLSLGTKSSTDVTTTQQSASGNAGMNCPQLLSLTLLQTNDVTATLTSTTNGLKLVNTDGSGDSINYTLYADSGFTKPFTVGQAFSYKTNGLLTLNILNGQGLVVPVYARTNTANVRSGIYRDTANFTWSYNLCNLLGALGLCLDPWTGSNKQSSATITLNVSKDCVIASAPNVNFGSQSFIGQFNTVTQNISLNCTKTEGYATYFSSGANASGGWNRMYSLLANKYLEYNFYIPSTSTVWNSTNKQTGVGTGAAVNIPYEVKLNPSQPETTAGNYSDTVVFTVEY